MTANLSGAQKTGLAALIPLGLYAVADVIGQAAHDELSYLFDVSFKFTAPTFAGLVTSAAAVVTSVLAVIALASRSNGLAKTTGALALLGAAAGVVGQLWLVSILSDYAYGASYSQTFTSYWPSSNWYVLPFTALLAVAAALCLVGPSRRLPAGQTSTAAAVARPPVAPPPMPTNSGTTPTTFFVQVDGAEYGPYSADEIRGFVGEGRVLPDTLIRPSTGRYEPAGHVPGLFPS